MRIDNRDALRREIAAWEARRNEAQAKIHWTFTIAVARQKLKKLDPDWRGMKENTDRSVEQTTAACQSKCGRILADRERAACAE